MLHARARNAGPEYSSTLVPRAKALVTGSRPRRHRWLVAPLVLLAAATCPAQTAPRFTISTIAGNGTDGYAGDSGAATSAQLNEPMALAIDSAGLLYISDQLNHRIRKVGADGVITTVAGSGAQGYGGDSKAATDALLYNPSGIALDASGNLYIADTFNHVVRKVASPNISTVAGDNVAGYYDGGTDLKATDADLNTPIGVVVDSSGNLYIADTLNHIIRKVTSAGVISIFAGNQTAGFAGDGGAAASAELNYPQGLALDAAGNLYVADTYNHRIRKITADGVITTVAGGTFGFGGDGEAATQASLSYPKTIALDAAGNLYIADCINSRIRMVTAADGKIWTIAGNGTFGWTGDGGLATDAQLRFPNGVAVDKNGKVYVADSGNGAVRLLTPIAGTGNASTAPRINQNGVTNSAAYGGDTTVAPGGWIDIAGANLATRTRTWAAADFEALRAPASLDGTTVTIGGKAAYVSAISPALVTALVPEGVEAGPQTLSVSTADGSTQPYTVAVEASRPSLYTPPSFVVDGKRYVGALLSDGSYALPAGALDGVDSRPVRPGETVVLYGAGFGAVNPASDVGRIVTQANTLVSPVRISIGGVEAPVLSQGLMPGKVGLYKFTVVVPAVDGGGAVPVTFVQGGVAGEQTLYMAVGN